MSRRSDDIYSLKTRVFSVQNPDGTFPAEGAVLVTGDALGHTTWTSDISVNSITATVGTFDVLNFNAAHEHLVVASVDASSGTFGSLTLVGPCASLSGEPIVLDGVVGIGTCTPAATLDVSGDVSIATTLTVENAGAAQGVPGVEVLVPTNTYAGGLRVRNTHSGGPNVARADIAATCDGGGGLVMAGGHALSTLPEGQGGHGAGALFTSTTTIGGLSIASRGTTNGVINFFTGGNDATPAWTMTKEGYLQGLPSATVLQDSRIDLHGATSKLRAYCQLAPAGNVEGTLGLAAGSSGAWQAPILRFDASAGATTVDVPSGGSAVSISSIGTVTVTNVGATMNVQWGLTVVANRNGEDNGLSIVNLNSGDAARADLNVACAGGAAIHLAAGSGANTKGGAEAGSGAGALFTSSGTTGGLYIASRGTTNGIIAFCTQYPEVERMRVAATGEVGIGTATPAYALDVNGDVRCQTLHYTALNPPISGGVQNPMTAILNGGGFGITNVSSLSVTGSITCSTLNYTTLNPPISPSVSISNINGGSGGLNDVTGSPSVISSVTIPATVVGAWYMLYCNYQIETSVLGNPSEPDDQFELDINDGSSLKSIFSEEYIAPYLIGSGPLANVGKSFTFPFQAQGTSTSLVLVKSNLNWNAGSSITVKIIFGSLTRIG